MSFRVWHVISSFFIRSYSRSLSPPVDWCQSLGATALCISNTMALTRNSAVEFDTASELLVAELALDDIAAVQATRKGKAREDAPRSDEDIAFDLQATSLNTLVDTLQDHRFALSIDRAIEYDAPHLQRFSLINQAECDDHRVAVALGHGHELPQQTMSQRMMMEQTVAQANRSAFYAFDITISDHQ